MPGHRLTFGEASLRSMQNAPNEQEGVRVALLAMRTRRMDRGMIALQNGRKRSIPPAE
jgi:hypothetical protein